MKILLIDAYDSFVHIIYQYLLSLDLSVNVIRNDQLSLDLIEQTGYNAIVLGPGPGHPSDAHYLSVIERFKEKIPIFGVCLGLQAITMAFGGQVIKAGHSPFVAGFLAFFAGEFHNQYATKLAYWRRFAPEPGHKIDYGHHISP